ncbi:MAG: peptidoglycan-binding domain-containing protein [Gelidibacter sp.]
MKSKFSNILKKLFLSSVAGIAANNTVVASSTIETFALDINDNEFSITKEKDLSPKLLLKLNNGNHWTALSHRSHRSHSSHRSHYSSTTSSSSTRATNSGSSRTSNSNSGSSSSSSSTSTPLKFNSSGSSNNNSNSSSPQTNTFNSTKPSSNSSVFRATSLKLGDRNLKLGMSGSDVTQLINILLKKGFLQLENGEVLVYGSYTYDETIEATVKRYQKDNNLTVDGNCGPTTVYHLLNK